jgi:hypothetical protein
LIFLSEKFFLNTVWLPDNLKKYLISNSFKKTFSDMKFRFFPTNENLIFIKCNYLTHPNNRWLIKNTTKRISIEYIKLANILREKIYKNHLFKHDSKYKYIFVSRSRAV